LDTKMMINQIPDETILTRQDILQIACEVDVSFRETLLRTYFRKAFLLELGEAGTKNFHMKRKRQPI